MTQRLQFSIDRAEVLARLAQNAILRPLGAAGLDALLTYSQPRVLRARAKLFEAGDEGSALYLVLSGWIKLARPGAAGRDIVLELAGPGCLFGEVAVLCGTARAACATALGPARVLSIDGRATLAALRANPDALLALVRLFGERLARTTAQMEDGQVPAEPRLARTLLRLAALDPKPAGRGLVIDLGLSQGDLASMTGLARESINKMLAAWREEGWISLEGRILTLADLPALRGIADCDAVIGLV